MEHVCKKICVGTGAGETESKQSTSMQIVYESWSEGMQQLCIIRCMFFASHLHSRCTVFTPEVFPCLHFYILSYKNTIGSTACVTAHKVCQCCCPYIYSLSVPCALCYESEALIL